MQTPKDPKKAPQKKKKKRLLKIVSVLVVFLILLVVILIPVLISSGKGREIILAKINDSIDGKTDFASLSMGWWKGIKVKDVSFNDSSGRTSVAVKQISTKPHYSSILFGSMSLGETIIDEPKVEINLKAQRPKETEQPERKTTTGKKSAPIVLPVNKVDLVVKDGNLKVTAPQTGTVEIAQINSKVNLRPPGERTDFDLAMIVAKQGKTSKISTEGQVKPGADKGWTFKGTSGDLTVKVDDLELGSLQPLLTWAGVEIEAEGKVSADIKSEIKDGKLENLSADIKAEKLDITGPFLKGDRLKTSTLDVQAKLERQQKMIQIENLEITSDWLTARATGMVPATFDSFSEFLQSDSNLSGNFDLDVARVFSQMPKNFSVKEGMKVTSGKLSGAVSTSAKAGKRKVTGNANLEGLKGTVDGKTIALEQPITAEVEITAKKDKIVFDKMDLASSFGNIDCSGTSELLNYTADADLSALQAQLGQFFDMGKYQFAGQAVENGTITMQKGQITAVGTSTIKNLGITSKDGASISEPQVDIGFDVGYDRKNRIVGINSLNTTASFGRVDINDAVVPLDTKTDKKVEMTVSAKVDLQKTKPYAVMFTSFPKEMQLAGFAESEVSIIAEQQGYRVVTDATDIDNLKVNYPGEKPFEANEVSIAFDAAVNPEQKTVNLRQLELISPQIKIHKGEFSQVSTAGKTKLRGRVDCEYDWAAVSTITGPYLPQGLKLEGQRKDTISFDSEYPTDQKDKLLENLNTKAKVGFTKAEYMGLNLGTTEVDFQIQNGLLKIAPFSTTVNNGQLKFAGEANLKDKPSLLKTTEPIQIAKDIQINKEMARKLLMYVNPIFANIVDVNGVTNFNCERLAIPLEKVNKNEIEVIGTISGDKIRLEGSDLLVKVLSLVGGNVRGQDCIMHPTRFVLQNGLLKYEDMQLDVGDNPVNFKGVIGLDKRLDMIVTLPYTMSGRTVRIGDKAGDRISLPLGGTTDKPELDLGKLLQDQAIKGVELLLDKLFE
ncbi:MAG: hypothetical protein GWN67_14695 [Phycisphaerae bacterium]|nr:DUF748 domain-containing protein [Phycisphaerae bacterium]NIP50694.1 DUF748 domain-containing protein [Phycisphaerae bacterium]NIS52379.1 DUF748 domain-containing protein [Phycisphaerae bacterium]NIU11940.1 DUF748 domain-containing protein [Phycisphaerae bacterium]NIU57585.1 hypothetical protein [Phycisphaerae bacterium]